MLVTPDARGGCALSKPSAVVTANARVRIVGLARQAEFNGRQGVAVRFLTAKGRWEVRLENGAILGLKIDNLECMPIEQVADDAVASNHSNLKRETRQQLIRKVFDALNGVEGNTALGPEQLWQYVAAPDFERQRPSSWINTYMELCDRLCKMQGINGFIILPDFVDMVNSDRYGVDGYDFRRSDEQLRELLEWLPKPGAAAEDDSDVGILIKDVFEALGNGANLTARTMRPLHEFSMIFRKHHEPWRFPTNSDEVCDDHWPQEFEYRCYELCVDEAVGFTLTDFERLLHYNGHIGHASYSMDELRGFLKTFSYERSSLQDVSKSADEHPQGRNACETTCLSANKHADSPLEQADSKSTCRGPGPGKDYSTVRELTRWSSAFITGLVGRPDLNGRRCHLKEYFAEKDRWRVHVYDENSPYGEPEVLGVRPANLKKIVAAPEDEVVGNTVEHKGYVFATLDFAHPNSGTWEHHDFLPLPDGWKLAEHEDPYAQEVVAKHGWGAEYLILSNGADSSNCSLVKPGLGTPRCRRGKGFLDQREHLGVPEYRGSSGQRVLIRTLKALPHPLVWECFPCGTDEAFDENHYMLTRQMATKGSQYSTLCDRARPKPLREWQELRDAMKSDDAYRVAQILVENDISPDAQMESHLWVPPSVDPPLFLYALKVRALEVAFRILDLRADVNKGHGLYGSPIEYVSRWGDTSLLQRLIERRASAIAAQPPWADTPLHSAAEAGNSLTTLALLDWTADVNARNDDGVTPLHCAAATGNEFIIEALIAKAADINAVDRNGSTPLQRAICVEPEFWEEHRQDSKPQVATVRMLLGARAALVNRATKVNEALALASSKGHAEVVQLLVEHTTSIERKLHTEVSCIECSIENPDISKPLPDVDFYHLLNDAKEAAVNGDLIGRAEKHSASTRFQKAVDAHRIRAQEDERQQHVAATQQRFAQREAQLQKEKSDAIEQLSKQFAKREEKLAEEKAEALKLVDELLQQSESQQTIDSDMEAKRSELERREAALKREKQALVDLEVMLHTSMRDLEHRQQLHIQHCEELERDRKVLRTQFSLPCHWTTQDFCSKNQLRVIALTSSDDLEPLRKLLEVNRADLGVGRDYADKNFRPYSRLELARAWRVENQSLWQKYVAEKSQMCRDLEASGAFPPPIETLKDVIVAAMARLPDDLQTDLNEVLLLHGTRPEHVAAILGSGLNERVAHRTYFGYGSYLAEDAAKADQYVTVDKAWCSKSQQGGRVDTHRLLYPNKPDFPGSVFYIIVFRVALGYAVHSQNGDYTLDGAHAVYEVASRGRNLHELVTIPNKVPALRYHSFVAETTPREELEAGMHKGERRVSRFREFILTHSDRMVPAYLLAVKRRK